LIPIYTTFEKYMTKNTVSRCPWLDLSKPDYVKYHDDEWGVPVHEDQKLFECLTLESAQAGLSWYTILKRRDGYRAAFAEFDAEQVAKFSEKKVEELMQNTEIIRHRGKIEATINNAKHFLDVQKEFGSFDTYLWGFVNNKTIVNHWKTSDDHPGVTCESMALSKSLKKRGFKFVGPTICYAFMQACGLVDDHSLTCYKKSQ
jgi:DNA-3-methyladenine glycosylase I